MEKQLAKTKSEDWKVSFAPTENQKNEVERWLKLEREETGEGFYCNWNIIDEAFKEKKIATISIGRKAIGFVIWSVRQFSATIDIVEIDRKYRKKGAGRVLITSLLNLLAAKDILAVDLQCSPPSSERVWRKFRFIDFPLGGDGEAGSNKWMYKILVPYLKPRFPDNGEVVLLWHSEPHHTNGSSPDIAWSLKFKKNTRDLVKPIIYPASRDWRIKWIRNNEVIKDDKIKYFEKEIDFGRFIVIRSLPSR
jgi:hypothetical protein